MPASNASSDGFERSPLHGEQEDSKPAEDAEPEAEVAAGGEAEAAGDAADAVNPEADAPAGDEPKKDDKPTLQVGPGPNTGSTAGYVRRPPPSPRRLRRATKEAALCDPTFLGTAQRNPAPESWATQPLVLLPDPLPPPAALQEAVHRRDHGRHHGDRPQGPFREVWRSHGCRRYAEYAPSPLPPQGDWTPQFSPGPAQLVTAAGQARPLLTGVRSAGKAVLTGVRSADNVTHKGRGFGFVTYLDPDVAKSVIGKKHVIRERTVLPPTDLLLLRGALLCSGSMPRVFAKSRHCVRRGGRPRACWPNSVHRGRLRMDLGTGCESLLSFSV